MLSSGHEGAARTLDDCAVSACAMSTVPLPEERMLKHSGCPSERPTIHGHTRTNLVKMDPQTPTLSEVAAYISREAAGWPRLRACSCCREESLAAFSTLQSFRFDRCRKCGFTFANPPPPADVLARFYASPYYERYRRTEAERLKRERYFSLSAYRDLRSLAQWLGPGASRSVLDYGCGPGSFLALLRDQFGFKSVEGLEIEPLSREIARDVYGLHLASNSRELTRQEYDVVVLLEVLEHVPEPDAFLRHVAPLVRDGGQLLVSTPAVDNLVARFVPTASPHYTAPSHVSLFTRRALSTLLARHGFAPIRFEVDHASSYLACVLASALFSLDFAPPRSTLDTNDALYRPNSIGRMLRLRARRQVVPCASHPVAKFSARAIARVDALLAAAVPHVLPANDHLYVLARRADVSIGHNPA